MPRPEEESSKIRRKGLRREPAGGWPLDHLFVGVATLRVTRELFLLNRPPFAGSQRAWDVALRSGVNAQGSADSMERLNRLGLVKMVSSGRASRAAPWFRLDGSYPLFGPLAHLFETERALSGRRPERIYPRTND
ncbi:MAG: hypothetical protein ACREK5_00780 [Gemmatimonadota bacterium]